MIYKTHTNCKYNDNNFWTRFPAGQRAAEAHAPNSANPDSAECNTVNNTGIPQFNLVTWNVNGLSECYPGSRRNTMYNDILQLTKTHTIIYLQETHLFNKGHLTLSRMLPKWGVYYSHGNSRSGGVITLLHPSITRQYHISQLQLHSSLDGHAVGLKLLTKSSLTPSSSQSKSILLLNLYMYTGANICSKQASQLSHLTTIHSEEYNYVAGDFNFVESNDDTSNSEGPPIKTNHWSTMWKNFLAHFRLTELMQPLHTYFQVSKSLDTNTSSRLDRIYTSLSEVDQANINSHAYLPFTTSSILDYYKKNSEYSPNLEEMNQIIKTNTGSDHVPVTGAFTTIEHKTRLPSIPQWVAKDIIFNQTLKQMWVPKPENDPYSELNRFKQSMYNAYHKLRKSGRDKIIEKKDRLARLIAAIKLLRATQTTPLNLVYINQLTTTHPELLDLIQGEWHSDGYFNTTKLKDHITHNLDGNSYIVNNDNDNSIWTNHRRKQSGEKAKKLKLILPSCRAKITSLHTHDPSSPIVTNKTKLANIALNHWGKIWNKTGSVNEPSIYLHKTPPPLSDIDVDIPTIDQLADNILATNNSAAGPDGIPFVAYRTNAQIAAPVLHNVLLAMTQGKLPPRGFNYANLHLLPKKQTHLIDDTRPISVTNTDNRIISKTLIDTILPQVKQALHKAQKGSLSGYQGYDHIHDITTAFYTAHEDNSTPNYYNLYVDTKKAFDSIHHQFLVKAIKRLGLPTWVVNVVRCMIHEVAVTPIFGGYTGVWIKITRGVKQGCPASPLFFAIVMDPLITRLSGVPGITIYAYVDDIALGTYNYKSFRKCMQIIDDFTSFSGLGINRHKTRIVAARNPREVEEWLGSSDCPWANIGVQSVASYVYLGILIGRKITVYDVWTKVFMKVQDRLVKYQATIRSLSPSQRIHVYNIFVHPLFSYLAPLYTLPTGDGPMRSKHCFDKIKRTISYHILPFGGRGCKFINFIAPHSTISLSTPLVDPWASCFSRLAALNDFSEHHGVHNVPNPDPQLKSMIPSTHIQNAGLDYINWHCKVHDTQSFDANALMKLKIDKRRKFMYNTLVSGHLMYENHSDDLVEKFQRRQLSCDDISISTVEYFFSQYSPQLAPNIRLFQHYLYFNMNVTSRRVRHFSNETIQACGLCGHYEDSIDHLLSQECPLFDVIYCGFQDRINLKLDINSLGAMSRRDANYLIIDINHIPQAHAISCINWAIWYCTRKYFTDPLNIPEHSFVTTIIYNYAIPAWTKAIRPSWGLEYENRARHIGSSNGRTADQKQRARARADEQIAAIPTTAITIYTDGGCNPNPGPCGAGVFVTTSNNAWEFSIALGRGTNAVGELWALAFACALLLALNIPLPPVFIATDSMLSLDIIEYRARPKKNIELAHLARYYLWRLRETTQVIPFWVAGHAGIQGNDHADKMATLGVINSAKVGGGMDHYIDHITKIPTAFVDNPYTLGTDLNADKLPP